jgi:hypothetical protein
MNGLPNSMIYNARIDTRLYSELKSSQRTMATYVVEYKNETRQGLLRNGGVEK